MARFLSLLLIFAFVSLSQAVEQDPATALLTHLKSAGLTRRLESLLPGPPPTHLNYLINKADSLLQTDPRHAIRLYRLAAVLGHHSALCTVATLLLTRHAGIERNIPLAVHHLRYASLKGQPDAHALLGFLHASGLADRHGVETSLSKALMYWTFSAASGNVYSSTALGFRYLHGIGVGRSCDAAARYYQKAAHAIATDPRHWPSVDAFMEGRPPLPSTLTESGRVRVNDKMLLEDFQPHQDDDVIEYYRHRASRRNSMAMLTLGGLHYFGGHGLERNVDRAREILEQAAQLGNGDAHGMLGHMYLGLGKNDTAMIHFRHSAAYENNKMGHYALGFIFYHGLLGQQRDFSKARMHFTLASEHKHAEASFHLGLIYWSGYGVEKDHVKAFHHFQEGARLGNIQSMLNVGTLMLNPSDAVKTPDCDLAVKHFKRVAEDGEWKSVFQYAHEAINKRDWYTSLYRHMQAAYAGIELAQYNAGMLLELLPADRLIELQHWDRSRVLRQVDELYEYSGMQGHKDSWIRNGDLHYIEGKDFAGAASKYEKAAMRKSAEGMVNLAFMHGRGQGFTENRETALRYLEDAKLADSEGVAPAVVAAFSLKVLWFISDTRERLSRMFPAETRLEEKPQQIVRQAIGSGDTASSHGVKVKNRLVEWEDLAILGALFAVLLTVLVVRSKRLARNHAQQQVEEEEMSS